MVRYKIETRVSTSIVRFYIPLFFMYVIRHARDFVYQAPACIEEIRESGELGQRVGTNRLVTVWRAVYCTRIIILIFV